MKTLLLYVTLSLSAASFYVYQTFSQDHATFALAFLRLISPKLNKAILYNALFSILVLFLSISIKILFGELREIERYVYIYSFIILQEVIEKTKHRILSFAFILIIISDDFVTAQLIAVFTLILALSMFHWLGVKRSEFVNEKKSQPHQLSLENQGNTKGHIKITCLFLCLLITDVILLKYFLENYRNVDNYRGDRHLHALLGFEILILTVKSCAQIGKYFLNLLEIFTLSHFEWKSTAIQVVEFVFTLGALGSHLWFFFFIYRNFGAPLHLILETIETCVAMFRIMMKFYNSISLIGKLKKLPDVTPEDIRNIDQTCLICLHEITSGKKISCGHIFHYSCLKGWIQGNVNQFCPKCKQPIKIEDSMLQGDSSVNDNLRYEGHDHSQGIQQNIGHTQEFSSLRKNLGNFGENAAIISLYNDIKKSYSTDLSLLTHQDFVKKLIKDVMEKEFGEKLEVGSVEWGLPRPAILYKSKEQILYQKKVVLLNKLLTSQGSLNDFLKKTNKMIVNIEKPEEEEKIDERVPENMRGRGFIETNLQPEKINEKDLKNLEDEEEGVRRRNLLREAAERRLANLSNENPEQ